MIILIAPCYPHCYPHYPFVIYCTITAITMGIVITIAIIENFNIALAINNSIFNSCYLLSQARKLKGVIDLDQCEQVFLLF